MSVSHHPPPVIYLLDARHSAAAARSAAAAQGADEALWLSQRGVQLGWIAEQRRPQVPAAAEARTAWQAACPLLLPGMAAAELPAHAPAIAAAHDLMEAILEGEDLERRLQQEAYAARLASRFELLAASYDEGDAQQIITLEFDALEHGAVAAENLWIRVSWLSYEEDDASLRFRFSFGMEHYEDVAADPARQRHAAALCEALFPESVLISANEHLNAYLRELLGGREFTYVERIVYFNAPGGGARFHHDVERGHLGVVFAQLSGRTAWLSLSTEQLLDEVQSFLDRRDADALLRASVRPAAARAELLALASNREALADYLHRRDNDPMERLLNCTPAFTRRLIEDGHAFILHPGDMILLPQHDVDRCAWHAVYCLDEVPGEALSFAVRHA
jgi:hypothetical protein